MLPKFTQVFVVGGGPAGTTAATLLVRQGFDVTLVEKTSEMSYKIGEFLLPSALEFFDLLGIREKVEAYGFKRKQGAYFNWGNRQWLLDFKEVAFHDWDIYTFQVNRAEFDQLLLQHARSQGVKVFPGITIGHLCFEGNRPVSATWFKGSTYSAISGEIYFDFLVDASGSYGLMANKYLHNRQFHHAFENLAIWAYWKNADIAKIQPENGTVTASTQEGSGWLWGIPLPDELLSVGLIINKEVYKARRTTASKEEILENAIADCPCIAELVAPGELVSPIKIDQDFSYSAQQFSDPGYFLVGDAACFLDPLLSTGIHLAFFTGMLTAGSLSSILRKEVTEARALSFYDKICRFHYTNFLVFVASFYHQIRNQASIQPDTAETEPITFISGLKDLQNLDPQMRDMVTKHMGEILSAAEEGVRMMTAVQKGEASKADLQVLNEQVFARIWKGMFGPLPEIDGLSFTKTPQLGLLEGSEASSKTLAKL